MRRYLRLFCGLAALVFLLDTPPASAADGQGLFGRSAPTTNRPGQTVAPPSLEQRRRSARRATIRQRAAQCRALAERANTLKTKPCAGDDRLDAKTDICHPRKNVWMPYIRWDPAAGRCKPRDSFDGVACVGAKRHYKPGKRYAHSPSHSVRMYGEASVRMEKALETCRRVTEGLKESASTERAKRARNCRKARRLGRADLVKFYCK